MKRLLYAALGVLILTFVVFLSSSVQAADDYTLLQTDPTPTPELWVGPTSNYHPDYYSPNTHETYDIEPPLVSDPDQEIAAVVFAGSGSAPGNGTLKIGGTNFSLTYLFGYTEGTTFSKCLENNNFSGQDPCSLVGLDPIGEMGLDEQVTSGYWDVTGNNVQVTGEVKIKFIYYGINPCEQPDPSILPEYGTNTLQGDDDVGDHYTLSNGTEYYLTTSEGPWNDGTRDRYDVALSFDEGETWTAIGDLLANDDAVEDACAAEDDNFHDAIQITGDEDHLTLDIRVNDEDDAFDDNSGSIKYTITNAATAGGGNCSQWYTTDELLASGSVNSTDELGDDLGIILPYETGTHIGRHYEIRILNTWLDGAMETVTTQLKDEYDADWYQSQYHPKAVCVETDKDAENNPIARSIWVQPMFGDLDFDLRANDVPGDFGDNSGMINYEVYSTDYNPPKSPCALSFEKKSLIEIYYVYPDASAGYKIPVQISGLTDGSYYVLEELGKDGYYDYPLGHNWDFEVSKNQQTWKDAEDWAVCTSPVDQNHNEFYFPAYQSHYWVRANDNTGNFSDNQGVLTLALYGAKSLKKVPGVGEDCSDYFTLGEELYNGEVAATAELGEVIPNVFEQGNYYAIEIEPPGWSDDGDPSYHAEMSYDNAMTESEYDFYSHSTWPGSLCSFCDEFYCTTFIEYQPGDYRIRAGTDISGDYGDNTGNVNYVVWSASKTGDVPDPTCELAYSDITWSWIMEDAPIPATLEAGEWILDELSAGYTYRFETSGDPAYQDSLIADTDPSYRLDISLDNGQTWQPLDEYVDCLILIDDEAGLPEDPEDPETAETQYTRGFKTIETTTGKVRVRFHDTVGVINKWKSNKGAVSLSVWVNDPGGIVYPNDPGSPWVPGGEWDPFAGCVFDCFRPTSLLHVAQWIEYARCRVQEWLSWCPYHTRKLLNMKDSFYDVEPFGTLFEMIDLALMMRNEVKAYNWGTEGGGAGETVTVDQPENFLFAPGEGGGAGIPMLITGEDSPWGEGDIVLRDTETPTYSTTCNNMLADSLGVRLALPLCFIFNILDQLGLMSWFQWLWDVAMIVGFIFYLNKKWVDKLQ